MKLLKKLISSILVLSVLSVSLVVPSSVFATQSNNVSQTVSISTEDVQQAKSVPTYVSKKALKWAIKNTTTITNLIGKYFGSSIAKKVGNVMHTYVKPALQKLERLEQVTYGELKETIYSVLKAAKLGSASARMGAEAIVTIIELFAPI